MVDAARSFRSASDIPPEEERSCTWGTEEVDLTGSAEEVERMETDFNTGL